MEEFQYMVSIRNYLVDGVQREKENFLELKKAAQKDSRYREINEFQYQIILDEGVYNKTEDSKEEGLVFLRSESLRQIIKSKLESKISNALSELVTYVNDIKHSQELLNQFFQQLEKDYMSIISLEEKVLQNNFVLEVLSKIPKEINFLKNKFLLIDLVESKIPHLKRNIKSKHFYNVCSVLIDQDIILENDGDRFQKVFELENQTLEFNFKCTRPVFAAFVIFLIENFYNNLSQAGFFDAFPNLKLNSKKVNSLTVTKGKSPKDLNHEKHLAMLEFLSSEVGL